MGLAVFAAGQTVWTGALDTVWYTAYATQERYTISTAEQLAGLAYLVRGSGSGGGKGGGGGGYTMSGKVITLGGDIALNALRDPAEWQGWDTMPPVNKWKAIGDSAHPFQGTFDGAGFVVRGVYIDTLAGICQGLFGFVNKGGAINRLRVAESFIRGGRYVGGLVGRSDSGAISGCYATGKITGTGDYVGGLVGMSRGVVTNSYAAGYVFGRSYVGGLVGAGVKDTISGSYAVGAVSGTGKFVGGLAGWDSGYAIANSYATGNVSGDSCVGGLAGLAYTAITNSYATGNVAGRGDFVGGLVGGKYGAAITNSYAAGTVSGGSGVYAGALVGWPARATPGRASIVYGYYNSGGFGAAGSAGIPKAAADMRSEEFVSLLNTAAYALSASRWILPPKQGGYPTLSGGSVPDSLFFASFANGDGRGESGAFEIANERQLVNLSIFVNCGMEFGGRYFKLNGNVALRGGPGDDWVPIGQYGAAFKGVFDGRGFNVSGLRIDDPTDAGRYLGLFGRVGKGGAVRNLEIRRPNIAGFSNVGGLAGWLGGTVSGCSVTNGIIAAFGGGRGAGGAGGLVGVDSAGAITNSYAVVNISGAVNMAGGLAGWNYAGGKVTYCYAKSSIAVIGDDVGGLVGRNDGASISDCYSDGAEVSGRSDETSGIGGIAVGGLVGANVDASVARCYAMGPVSGRSSVGGLVGLKLGSGKIESGYYKIESVGVVSDYGIPKTDREMRAKGTYDGWDFSAVWGIDEKIAGGYPYPYLMSIMGGANGVSEPSADRAAPPPNGKISATPSPPPPVTTGFAAGPNPAAGSGELSFFRKGKRIADCELSIYDASGNVINKIKISDRAASPYNRKTGSWNLTDAKGRKVPEGTYLIKGTLTGADGKREKVSVPVGVVK